VPGGLARIFTSYTQVDGFHRGTLSHSVDQERESGQSKSSKEIFVKFRESLDLAEAQGGYKENVQRFKSQEGQSHRSESQGPSYLHVISCIRDSRVEAPSCCNENCDITRHDIPMSLKCPSMGTHVIRSKGSQGSENQGFREHRNLVVWNRETRNPDGRVVWAIAGASGG
jgi:hypothetical protein